MVFARTATLVFLALAPASAVHLADAAEPARAGESGPTANELNLDRLISVYEDLAAALSGVEDSTDADLVASRVAADFLLLRGMGQVISGGEEVSTDTMRSFRLRNEHARSAVSNATARLRENNCYGSAALPAALSLSVLISGKTPSGADAESAVQELVANNREMMSMLLDEAVDKESAAQVAGLINTSLRCEAALSAYAEEVGTAHLDEEQRSHYARRQNDFLIDIRNHHARLNPNEYFGNAFLRDFVESRLTPER